MIRLSSVADYKLPVTSCCGHPHIQHQCSLILGFLDGSAVKDQPAVQETRETQIGSLGQENPLEKEMAIHSSILAWTTPWTEESGGL